MQSSMWNYTRVQLIVAHTLIVLLSITHTMNYAADGKNLLMWLYGVGAVVWLIIIVVELIYWARNHV